MTGQEYRRLAGRVFADLGRARVTPRQAMLYERLLRVTLAVGRQGVRIPRLDLFGRFGLSRGNVSECFNGFKLPSGQAVPGLVELGMLQLAESEDGGLLVTMLPDAAQWRCGWRFAREDDAAFLAELDAVADQVQGELIAREDGLPEARAEVSAENAARMADRSHATGPAARSYCGNGRVPTVGTAGDTSTRVTCTPVLQAFKAGQTGVQVTSTQVTEQTVMDRLQRWLGDSPHESDRNDFAYWSGYWRTRHVRVNPDLVNRALADFEARGREGWEARTSRVGALKDLLKRWS